MAYEPAAQPVWTTAQGGRAWNQLWLGGVSVPGVATPKGVSVGQDVDTKKAKGSDGATSTDNGVKPSKFTIEVKVTGAKYGAFLTAMQSFNPRRPGAQRAPLDIRHPGVNQFGIKQIRVVDIEMPDAPTGRAGATFVLHCEEWFPIAKPTKSKLKPENNPNRKFTEDPNALARDMQTNLSGIPQPSIFALPNL